ncbi:FAD-binding oxidoreductase [Nocardia sp. CA-129566]|uniref:FAD-binding oxidoreductase n=1 Tax=Nocardia sp. CA-129566 TaxID=3239976 RepID=UPI003D966707
MSTSEPRLIGPADPGWDAARQAWNLAADQKPAYVAEPTDPAEVVAVLDYARRAGLRVAPQGTGHNAGAYASLAGCILLTTRRMREVEVRPDERIARVGAGAIWAEVTEATTPHGLYPMAGSSPDISTIGFCLGGGVAWLGRKYGLAANHVTAVELVLPDGEIRRVTATSDAELFWGLRGGGGNFGVVTALEFRLLSIEVYAGMFLWPFERRDDVLDTWYKMTRTAPEELTTALRIMHWPVMEDGRPEFLSGRSLVVIDGAFIGSEADGAEAVAALRALEPEMDTWAPITAAELSHMHMDPEQPTPFASAGMVLGDLDDAGLRAFTDAVDLGSPLLFAGLRHTGGAFARQPEDSGALGALPGSYLMEGIGLVTAPELAEPIDIALRQLRAAMSRYDTGRVYANFVDRPTDVSTVYDEASFRRLRELRASVDPDGLMVASHPIPVGVDAKETVAQGMI